MGIGVYQPPKKSIITGASEGGSKGKMFGSIGGLISGAALGALAIGTGGAATPLAIAAGGLGGAGGGAGLGGLVGGMFDKKASEGTIKDVAAGSMGIPKSENSVSRRLENIPQSPLATLGEGLGAIAQVNDPVMNKLALPPVYKAYIKAYNQQNGAMG